jgi:hypothetical protein
MTSDHNHARAPALMHAGGDEVGSFSDGSAKRPFLTLRAAQLAVRQHLAAIADASGAQHVTVRVARGSYFDTSLVFTEADSPRSSDGGRVVWMGEPGAVVFGGRRVSGWQRTPMHGGRVWATQLSPELIDSSGRALFTTLVQGNRSAVWAREPNFGGGYLPCSGDPVVTCPTGTLPPGLNCTVTGQGTPSATSACSVFTRAGYSSDIRVVVATDVAKGTITMETDGVDHSRYRNMTTPRHLYGPPVHVSACIDTRVSLGQPYAEVGHITTSAVSLTA